MSKDVKDPNQFLDDMLSLSLPEIDGKIEDLQRQVKTLTMLRKMVAVRQGAEDTSPAANGQSKRVHTLTVRKRLRTFFDHHGPGTLDDIAATMPFSREAILKGLDCNQFGKTTDGKYKRL